MKMVCAGALGPWAFRPTGLAWPVFPHRDSCGVGPRSKCSVVARVACCAPSHRPPAGKGEKFSPAVGRIGSHGKANDSTPPKQCATNPTLWDQKGFVWLLYVRSSTTNSDSPVQLRGGSFCHCEHVPQSDCPTPCHLLWRELGRLQAEKKALRDTLRRVGSVCSQLGEEIISHDSPWGAGSPGDWPPDF